MRSRMHGFMDRFKEIGVHYLRLLQAMDARDAGTEW